MLLEDRLTAAGVRSGDQRTFDELVTRFRREIHVHCYAMVGSFDEARPGVRRWLVRRGAPA